MGHFHEAQISKIQRIMGYILSLIASVSIALSGVLKWVPVAWAMAPLEKLELAPYAFWVGAAELVCVVLYWLPRTQSLGFFFLCTYTGAILLAEILMGEFPLPALILGACIYLGTLLRRPTLLSGR